MSGRKLAGIEKQLLEAGAHTGPSDWLTKLFCMRHIEDNAASDYLRQSPYYQSAGWDIPQVDMDWEGSECSFGYSEGTEDGDAESTEDAGADEENHAPWTSSGDPWQNENEQLQQRFMDIFNDVLLYFGLGTSRRALATDSTNDEEDDIFYEYELSSSDGPPRFSTRPDLLLLGEDARQLPRPLDTYNRAMSVALGDRDELYRGCVAVAKVQKVDGRRGHDAMLAKLATCAQQCFLHQPGRRFVYGLALSHDCFQLVYFDHSGAVESAPLSIHANAVELVQVVRMLGGHDLRNLGFDTTIYWDQGRRYVDVLYQALGARKSSSRKYEIEHVIFQRPQLFDRGTTCWVVTEVGGTESMLMKDIWEEEEQREEFLTFASKRGVLGVRKLLGVDRSWSRRPLSITSLRLGQSIRPTGHKNRIFSRVLLKLQGPSIRHFESGLQLLQGLRDAVDAHYRLVQAGVLHRDITPDAILLSQGVSDSGTHATLIDLKKATKCVRGRAPADKDNPHIGSLMFRSANNALACTTLPQGPRRYHDFLDDLESFLWVYAWSIMVQDGPGEAAFVSKPCSFIALMQRTDALDYLYGIKYVFMGTGDEASPTPYFSKTPYTELLHNLRNLCEGYRGAKQDGDDLFPHMDDIYRRFLVFFDSAIEQLGGTSRPINAASPPAVDPTLLQLETKLAFSLPLRRIQPDRLAKRARDEDVVAHRKTKKPRVAQLPPKRSTKRPFDDDDDASTPTRESKKRRIDVPFPKLRARKEDAKPPTSISSRRPREGTRRSERIRKGRLRVN